MSITCRSDRRGPWQAAEVERTWFPEDLRTWLRGPALMQLAHAVAQDQTVSGLRPVFSRSATRFHHPWRMLALLTYAYASGIWQSRALADIAALDPHLAELCHGEPPSEDVIRRFRNQNSASIRRCLEHLLRLLWCERHNARLADLHPLLIAEILRNVRSRLRHAEQSDEGNHRFFDAKEEFLKEEEK